jgi:16S rRNA (guanine1516-N2)-methyltransferase
MRDHSDSCDLNTSSELLALAVCCASPSQSAVAEAVAERLGLPLLALADVAELAQYSLVIWVSTEGIGLKQPGRKTPNPVIIDFVGGALGFRGKRSQHTRELVAKAVGIKIGQSLRVLDATAGLGRDAFILAARGCDVQMLERSPVVALMLEDALQRGMADADVADVVARLQLQCVNATEYMCNLNPQDYPEVVYLDPMFPERSKSASVKKEMQFLQQLLGVDDDIDELFTAALQIATKRVVVKRPKMAPCISEHKPHHVIEGKSGRFDIYST